MPTRRSTGPRSKAAAPIASSRRRWAPRCASAAMLEHDLRHAISRGELRLVYQPQTRRRQPARSSASRRCCAGSIRRAATSRRRSSSRSPRKAARSCRSANGCCAPPAARRRAGRSPLTIAVNVSAVQLHNANFAHLVHEILFADRPAAAAARARDHRDRAGPRPRTARWRRCASSRRSACASPWTISAPAIRRSSNLRAFPFDKIKIDGSFIRSVDTNEQAATIVRAVLGLGRGLGLPVLAEGVETEAELQFLMDGVRATKCRATCSAGRRRSSSSGT